MIEISDFILAIPYAEPRIFAFYFPHGYTHHDRPNASWAYYLSIAA
jgi:hypothetical protein